MYLFSDGNAIKSNSKVIQKKVLALAGGVCYIIRVTK